MSQNSNCQDRLPKGANETVQTEDLDFIADCKAAFLEERMPYANLLLFLVVGIVSDMVSNKTFYYSPGLMERAEAFLFFTLMILFPSQFIWLGILFSVLALFTAIQRVFEFRSLDIR